MFLRDKDLEREMWDGERLGIIDAPKTLKLDSAFNIKQIQNQLSQLINANSTVYFDAKPCEFDTKITALLNEYNIKSLQSPLSEMRLIKDKTEISSMQKSANISIIAHQQAMQQIKPGMFEYELQSIFDSHFTKNNAQHAYTPIVAGGKNACILHYIKNNKILNNGDLVLIDAGCEFEYYASDITRTFPVNGRFSVAQKQIYQLVLNAQLAAIECIKPDISINKPHQIASDIIKNGLISLGLLAENEALSKFYMHGTSHWLGIDVHDVGAYKINQQYRTFKKGMVVTVEPGIYINKNDKINPIYHNIGIRIEDDILVTATGNTVLTKNLAKTINEIEALMNQH
jgi:Xaa-Pro aminopeptidase